MQTMTPTEHEKREWSRMAQDAYSKDLNDVGHRFSGAAALRIGQSIPLATFDSLQEAYRAWLVFGAWPNDCQNCGKTDMQLEVKRPTGIMIHCNYCGFERVK